ncbi:RhuM family protein [Fluviicola taffensis]|uniref:RhuM family protein n=1 Tax=Fluviicola taffensis TaxID=191579 RepID=UPI0031379D43
MFNDGELDRDSTTRKNRVVRQEGNRQVNREIEFFNLDAIISVGYRVNSQNATRFRIWATNVLREYLTKGFVLDDDRLKQGKSLFGKDYFDELIERIRKEVLPKD